MKGLEKKERYLTLRREFLSLHGQCGVCQTRPASEVHHKLGRDGWRLLATEYWLAVCRECHDFIERHRQWAYENGYLLKRNAADPTDNP